MISPLSDKSRSKTIQRLSLSSAESLWSMGTVPIKISAHSRMAHQSSVKIRLQTISIKPRSVSRSLEEDSVSTGKDAIIYTHVLLKTCPKPRNITGGNGEKFWKSIEMWFTTAGHHQSWRSFSESSVVDLLFFYLCLKFSYYQVWSVHSLRLFSPQQN